MPNEHEVTHPEFLHVGNSSLAARFRRYSFAMAMLIFAMIGGVWLALSLKEIPANQSRINQTTVNVVGEVLSGDISNQLNNLKQLSRSSLVWTALTDSEGRDAYLRPFLNTHEQESEGNRILLLDYRGRPVLGSMPATIPTDLVKRMVAKSLSDKTPQIRVVDAQGHPFLVAAFPVLYPYNQESIGALLSTINMSNILDRRTSGLAENMGLDLLIDNSAPLTIHPDKGSGQYFPADFRLTLSNLQDVDSPSLRLYSTVNPWTQPLIDRCLVSIPLVAILSLLLWHLSGLVAQRITRRLNRLADACQAISEGRTAEIDHDPASDEIGILSRTLRQALEAYALVNVNLEKGVEEKTAALSASEKRFRDLFDKSSSVMWIIDPQSGRIVDANRSAVSFYGYPRDQLLNLSTDDINTSPPNLIAENRQLARQEIKDTFYFSHRLASGEIREVEIHSSPIIREGETFLFSIIHDITERKRAEAKLQLAATVFTHADEGILITQTDGEIIDVNDAFCKITGYPREEVLGRNPRFLKSDNQGPEFYDSLWSDLLAKGNWEGEIWNRRKNGELYAEWLTISAVRDSDGDIQKYVGLFSDITELKAHEQKLEHIAHHDALTNLPNRVLLADRLQQAMAHTLRREQPLAVAYLDLDGFKAVNDQHGHDIGDQLLIAVTERLKNALREGDTLARIGGDEFVAVLIDVNELTASVPMFKRLLEAASTPVTIAETVLQVSASIGITFYPQNGDVSADMLLRQADQAMYQAKQDGKNRYHIFNADPERNLPNPKEGQ
ncbi:MAG: diguanylate cyclase [Betaproteobacteria bacterium]